MKKIDEKFDVLLDFLLGTWGFIISIGLIVISVLIGKPFPLSALILKELGIAAFILVGIALTLDRRHRKNFQNEMRLIIGDFKENSFQALFSWFIPQDFLSEVKEQIFMNDIIRENCEIEYSLLPISKEVEGTIDESCNLDNRILIDVIVKSKIKNIKNNEIPFSMDFFVEKEDAPKFNRVYLVTISNEKGLVQSYNEDMLKKYLQSEDAINNRYTIDEIVIPKGNTILLEVRYRAIRAYRHTREVFTLLKLTEKLRVHVKSCIPGLTILAEAISPHKLNEIPMEDTMSQYKIEKCWMHNKPLLPHQGVMVWWHKD